MKPGPSFPLTRRYYRMLSGYLFPSDRHLGTGGYAPNSEKIPVLGWVCGVLFVVGFIYTCWVGTCAGF